LASREARRKNNCEENKDVDWNPDFRLFFTIYCEVIPDLEDIFYFKSFFVSFQNGTIEMVPFDGTVHGTHFKSAGNIQLNFSYNVEAFFSQKNMNFGMILQSSNVIFYTTPE